MKEQIAKDWAAALRSGEYEQGEGRLYRGGKYCCLGVLARLCEKDTGATDLVDYDKCFPSREVGEWAGMQMEEDETVLYGRLPGEDKDEPTRQLSDMNDGCGGERKHSFAEIADIIEQNWEKL